LFWIWVGGFYSGSRTALGIFAGTLTKLSKLRPDPIMALIIGSYDGIPDVDYMVKAAVAFP
jgi:hypothetical protein